MSDKVTYFLRLADDLFSSVRIKRMRSLGYGDSLVLVYIRMQLLSAKTGGVLEFHKRTETFAEEIAYELGEKLEVVAATVRFLEDNEMLLREGDQYTMPFAVDNIITVKESSSAERVRRFREKIALQSVTCNTESVTCNVTCNAERNQEKKKSNTKEVEVEREDTLNINPNIYNNNYIYKESTLKHNPVNDIKGTAEKPKRPLTNLELFYFLYKGGLPDEAREAVERWLEYKRDRHFTYKEVSMKTLITKATNEVTLYGTDAFVDAIDTAISNGYQGYHIRDDNSRRAVAKKGADDALENFLRV